MRSIVAHVVWLFISATAIGVPGLLASSIWATMRRLWLITRIKPCTDILRGMVVDNMLPAVSANGSGSLAPIRHSQEDHDSSVHFVEQQVIELFGELLAEGDKFREGLRSSVWRWFRDSE